MSSKVFNTAEAARFLRVSEASIRRWSDAGLLDGSRVGRRRERRFTEASLLAFMVPGGPAPKSAASIGSDVSFGGIQVPLGAHLAVFYGSDPGRLRLAVPLFAEGLRSRQPCFLVAAGPVLDAYMTALRDVSGVDVDAARRSGLLQVTDGPGVTVEDAMLFWEKVFWRAVAGGPTVLRIVGDMGCERQLFATQAEMIRYEHSFSSVGKRFPTITLCQYDVREFDGTTVFDALRAHPDLYSLPLGLFLN